jgi:RNA polymerase subunit RPABC4/transcription elongation factor Spt4
MPINYKGTAPKPLPSPVAKPAQAQDTTISVPASKVATVSKTPGLKFIKRGAQAQAIADQEEKKAELRGKDNVFRFYLPKEKSCEITFLDGNLKDGILDIPFYHEHQVNMNGSWQNWFICTQDEEPCPICDGGTSASYVGILTVIDHSEYTSKKDNKVHKDGVKLFVAKRDTIKLLQKYAAKRGGLRGCRFEVSRTGDKSASVGSSFDFTEKMTESQLVASYGSKDPKVPDRSKAVDYEKHLGGMYQPASELRKLGFGEMQAPIGSESGGAEYDV